MVDRLRELRYDRGHPAQNVRVYTDEEDDLRVGTPSDLVQAFAHKYENLGLAQDDWLDVTAVPRPPLTPKHCAACVRKQVDSIPLEDILPFDTPERNAGEFDDLPFVIGGDFSLGEVRMIYDPQTHRPMVSTWLMWTILIALGFPCCPVGHYSCLVVYNKFRNLKGFNLVYKQLVT